MTSLSFCPPSMRPLLLSSNSSLSLKSHKLMSKSPLLSFHACISSFATKLHDLRPKASLGYVQIPDTRLEVGYTTSLFPYCSPPQTPASAMRGAESDVMRLLLRERIVFLGGSIDDFLADAIMSQLILMDFQDPTKDIRLFINSPGGSLSATMAIYDAVQLVRADVSTIALGIAASTSSLILGSGTKGKRLAMPNTRIMLHQPLGGVSGQALDVEIQAKEIMNNKENVTRIISNHTGRTYEQVQKDIDRDRYMSPIEAVEYGLIDGVIDRDAIIPLMPVPERVKPKLNYEEIVKDPRKFLIPDIPDDEIY